MRLALFLFFRSALPPRVSPDLTPDLPRSLRGRGSEEEKRAQPCLNCRWDMGYGRGKRWGSRGPYHPSITFEVRTPCLKETPLLGALLGLSCRFNASHPRCVAACGVRPAVRNAPRQCAHGHGQPVSRAHTCPPTRANLDQSLPALGWGIRARAAPLSTSTRSQKSPRMLSDRI